MNNSVMNFNILVKFKIDFKDIPFVTMNGI